MRSIAHHDHGQKPERMKFLRIIFGYPEGARNWHILFFAMLLHSKNTPHTAVYFSGAVGGIRTLVPLLTTTRFPVVLVMTSSIPLHIHLSEEHSNDNYTKYSAFVKRSHQKK